jgi:hypothetical protein
MIEYDLGPSVAQLIRGPRDTSLATGPNCSQFAPTRRTHSLKPSLKPAAPVALGFAPNPLQAAEYGRVRKVLQKPAGVRVMVLQPLAEAILQELLEAEMTEALGAEDATAEARVAAGPHDLRA